METTRDFEDHETRRCRVAALHERSVLLDPGDGRARFVLPREFVPDDVDVGEHVSVSTRPGPSRQGDGDADVGAIFDEALETLEDIEAGWSRPGMPADASQTSA